MEIVTEKQVPFIKKVIKEIIKEVSAEEWDRLLKSRYRWKYKSLSSGLCKFLWRRLYIDRSVSPPSSTKARTVGVGLYLERRSGDRSINVYVERVVPKLFRHFKATRARFRN